MGMDVFFNREEAENAGMEFVADEGDLMFEVPGLECWVVDSGSGDEVIVTANKWGRVYQPLTEWLKANSIDWTEG